jgi:hypothetical protein
MPLNKHIKQEEENSLSGAENVWENHEQGNKEHND